MSWVFISEAFNFSFGNHLSASISMFFFFVKHFYLISILCVAYVLMARRGYSSRSLAHKTPLPIEGNFGVLNG